MGRGMAWHQDLPSMMTTKAWGETLDFGHVYLSRVDRRSILLLSSMGTSKTFEVCWANVERLRIIFGL